MLNLINTMNFMDILGEGSDCQNTYEFINGENFVSNAKLIEDEACI